MPQNEEWGKNSTIENKIRKISGMRLITYTNLKSKYIYLELKTFSGDSSSIIVQVKKQRFIDDLQIIQTNILYLTKPDLEPSLG